MSIPLDGVHGHYMGQRRGRSTYLANCGHIVSGCRTKLCRSCYDEKITKRKMDDSAGVKRRNK